MHQDDALQDPGFLDRVTISGQHLETGDALRTHVVESLAKMSAKYFNGTEDIRVVFAKGSSSQAFSCHIRVHPTKGQVFDGRGDDPSNIYRSFAVALEHVDKQLRRQKRQLREDKHATPAKYDFLNAQT